MVYLSMFYSPACDQIKLLFEARSGFELHQNQYHGQGLIAINQTENVQHVLWGKHHGATHAIMHVQRQQASLIIQ